jgi:hypothetical protein
MDCFSLVEIAGQARSLQNNSGRSRKKGGFYMCYNCGCGLPDNDGGSAKNITDKTFVEAAKAAGQSVEDAKKNTLELLKKSLGESKK